MLFDDKKLQLESVNELIRCPIHSIEPYALMLAPVYVLMKLNKKLVSVKAPLDFFTQEELEKLNSSDVLYLPKFVKSSVRFQTAARVTKNIFTVTQAPLNPTPYEISKESFNVLSELWGKQVQIEPFFMSIFADELCSPLDFKKLIWAREHQVVKHDHGLLLSGTFVFIAVHLGWFDLELLSRYRNMIYEKTVQGEEWGLPANELETIIQDLNQVIEVKPHLNIAILRDLPSEWAKKLASRLDQLYKKRKTLIHDSVSIYGPEGFVA